MLNLNLYLVKRILIFISVIISFNSQAQLTEFGNYNWESKPKISIPDSSVAGKRTCLLFEKHISEIYVNHDQRFEELNVYHLQVKVETLDALTSYSQLYIPVNNVIKIEKIRARFISKNGVVVELPQESIKEVSNLENKGNFKLFAIEGAEVGGVIEYFYILRKTFNPFGSIIAQSNIPKYNYELLFVYPNKLEYLFKSYNGLPDVTDIQSNDSRTYKSVKVPFIEGVSKERYANYDSNLMRIEYTLSYNNYSGALRLYSWSKASSYFYNNLFLFNRNEEKALSGYLKRMKLKGLGNREKIIAMEDFVKSEIVISKEVNNDLTVDQIIDLKQASKTGITKLMIGLLMNQKVRFELVLTTDRTKKIFDRFFNSMNYLDEYLIYLPELDDYIFPGSFDYRMGVLPDSYCGNYGIFFHTIDFDKTIQSLAYDIKPIPAPDYRRNGDSLFIAITLDPDKYQLNVKTRRVFIGTVAQGFQAYWDQIPQERKIESINSIFNMGSDNNQLVEYKITGASPRDIGKRPLIWNISQRAPSLVELADEDLIVKIGEVIGEQSQLYRDTERKLPVATSNVMHYYREISFIIPDGYKLANLDELNMKTEMMHNSKISCAFTSTYKIENDILKVFIDEYYTEQDYPVDRFEDFRAVINAAADFNKKTIVLTKD